MRTCTTAPLASVSATLEQWICDYCTIASFPTFEEAEAHEAICSCKPAVTNNNSAISIDNCKTRTIDSNSIVVNSRSHIFCNNGKRDEVSSTSICTPNTVKSKAKLPAMVVTNSSSKKKSNSTKINAKASVFNTDTNHKSSVDGNSNSYFHSTGKSVIGKQQGSMRSFLRPTVVSTSSNNTCSKKVSDSSDEVYDRVADKEEMDILSKTLAAAKFAAEMREKRRVERERYEAKRKKQAVNPFFLCSSKKSKLQKSQLHTESENSSSAVLVEVSDVQEVVAIQKNSDVKPKGMNKMVFRDESQKVILSCSLSNSYLSNCSSYIDNTNGISNRKNTSSISSSSLNNNEATFFPCPSHVEGSSTSNIIIPKSKLVPSTIEVEHLMPDPMESLCELQVDSEIIDLSVDTTIEPLSNRSKLDMFITSQLELLNEDYWQEHVEYVNDQWPTMCGADFAKCPRSILEVDPGNLKVLRQLDEYLESFQCTGDFDDDLFEDSEDELEFCKVIILHGPPSSGKTAALSTLSERYNIIELHPGECRSGSQIKQKIGEACTSRRLQLGGNSPCENLFKSTKQHKSKNRKQKKRSNRSLGSKANNSLIHIEHPEINVAEDVNMFSSMSQLLRRSKIPIIITTNDLEYITYMLGVPDSAKCIKCDLPSLDYCTYRILLALSCANTNVIGCSTSTENLVISIEDLVKTNHFDLRKILAHLSSFGTIHSASSKNHEHETEHNEIIVKASPTITDIEPDIFPTYGGEASIRFSGCNNIIYILVNGERVSFEKTNDTNCVRIQIPPCSYVDVIEEQFSESRSQLDDLDQRKRYSNRFAEVVVVSSENGVLSRSDWRNGFYYVQNARNIDHLSFEQNRTWNIIYDLSSSNNDDSSVIENPHFRSTEIFSCVDINRSKGSSCDLFNQFIVSSDEVLLQDFVEVGGGEQIQMASLGERASFRHHALTDIIYEAGSSSFYNEEEFIVQSNNLRSKQMQSMHMQVDFEKKLRSSKLEDIVNRIIPPSAKRATFVSGLSDSILNDQRAILDYIPMLRCMAALDMSSPEEDVSYSRGRKTRRQTKRSYFESNLCYSDSFTRVSNSSAAAKDLSKVIVGFKKNA